MGLIRRLFLGDGSLPADVRDEIAAEGTVRLEEGLPGSFAYKDFRMPGRRISRGVQAQTVGLGISEKRLVVFGSSGRAKVVDVPFSDPRSAALSVALDDEKVVIAVDLDRFGTPGCSGTITVRAKSASAAAIVEALRERLAAPN